MIRVIYYSNDHPLGPKVREYPDWYEAKIVHGGVLRIEEPAAYDVPELGQGKDKQIGKKDAKPVAIFSGQYMVEYVDGPEEGE